MRKPVLYFFLGFILTANSFAQSPGDLLITPPRVVFEGSRRTQAISLVNIGSDTSRYALSIVRYRMNENGQFEQIEEPDSGQYLADDFLRFFPRQVVLAPNETQTVRMQVTMPRSTPDREYRSHLYFRAIDNERARPLQPQSQDLSIQLKPVFGWAIPILVRKGDLNVDLSISDIQYIAPENNQPPGLGFTIHRNGTKSTFGDIDIVYENFAGEQRIVSNLRGVAVYTPNRLRKFVLPLDFPSGMPAAGQLIIIYKSQSDLEKTILAKAVVKWP